MKTYTKAVSATLAGALAVGMVPAMALADDAQLELLAVGADADVAEGKIVEVVNHASKTLAAAASYSFDVDTSANPVAQFVQPSKVEIAANQYVTIGAGFDIEYWKVDATVQTDIPGTNKVKGTKLTTAPVYGGSYYAVAKGNGQDNDTTLAGAQTYSEAAVVAVPYTINPVSLEGAYIYEGDIAKKDYDVDYTGAALNIAIGLGDKTLTYGSDYTGYWVDSNGDRFAGNPQNAGTYTYKMTGAANTVYQGATKNVVLTINQVNLANETLVLADMQSWTAPTVEAVLAASNLPTTLKDFIRISRVSGPDENGKPGNYVYKLEDADTTTEMNVVGSNTVSFSVYSKVADYNYDGEDIKADDVKINLSDPADKKLLFDANEITVLADDGVTELGYEIVVTDALNDNAPAKVSDINTAGKWNVTIKVVDPSGVYGGKSQTVTYDVTNGLIDPSKQVYVKYNGVNAGNAITHYYDGKDALDSIETLVKSAAGTVLVEGVDYEVKIVNDDTKKEVAEAVNAGNYKIVIESETWDGAVEGTGLEDEINLTVAQSEITELRIIEWGNYDADNGAKEVPYTGEPIALTIEYTTAQMKDADGKQIYAPLPAGYYELSFKKGTTANPGDAVKEIIKVGNYAVTVNLTPAGDKNFDVATAAKSVLGLEVCNYKKFDDVASTAWYFNAVNEAAEIGLVNGFSGSNLYGPEKAIKRGDFACILFNMANVDAQNQNMGWVGDENSYNENTGYDTGFSDVNGKAYWAEAIAWANKAGVASGYDGEFRPNDPIKRQEAIAMVANYAEAMGLDMDVDAAAVLAAYPDGAKVSGWAKDVVAWACDNDVAGNGKTLNPLGNITRAEAAAVVLNFYKGFIA